MNQNMNGKAFEYSLAVAFADATGATIVTSEASEVASECYSQIQTAHKTLMTAASAAAAGFLLSRDGRIALTEKIMIQNDGLGMVGDVRDVVLSARDMSVGISAKHNHEAVKHSRLSGTIDFGREWAGYPCDPSYFRKIRPVFDDLRDMQEQGVLFRDIKGKESRIYLPVLIAFEDEIRRLCEAFQGPFVANLFRYLLGRNDFYKVVLMTRKRNPSVSIQSVNDPPLKGRASKCRSL